MDRISLLSKLVSVSEADSEISLGATVVIFFLTTLEDYMRMLVPRSVWGISELFVEE